MSEPLPPAPVGENPIQMLRWYVRLGAWLWRYIVAIDKSTHSAIQSRFPATVRAVDGISKWFLEAITDNKFGYVLTPVLLILSIAGIVNITITLATMAIWWILVLWVIGSRIVSQLTIPTRLAILLIVGTALGVACLGFRDWSLRRYVASLTKGSEQQTVPAIAIQPAPAPLAPKRYVDSNYVPHVKLLFKASPLFTPARRMKIQRTVDAYYDYLTSIGFEVLKESPQSA